MKKALVLSLFVMLGVGVACSAQLQGEWDTWLKLDITPTFGLNSFYSFLDIQYLVGGWTLEEARYPGFWAYWMKVAAMWPLHLVQQSGILGYRAIGF